MVLLVIMIQTLSTGFGLDDPGEATESVTEEVLELMGTLESDPVFLRNGDLGRLALLPMLSESQIESIERFVGTFGAPTDPSELAAVEAVGSELASVLTRFVRFERSESEIGVSRMTHARDPPGPPVLNIAVGSKRRLERRRGYVDTTVAGYLGDPTAIRGVAILRLGNTATVRLAVDKDAGEPLSLDPSMDRLLFDFVGGSLEIRDVGPLVRLVIGDFSVRFGSGLALWTGSRVSTPTVGFVSPRMSGAIAKSGAAESGFVRGLSARLRAAGRLAVDIHAGLIRGEDSGLHRNDREIERTAGWDTRIVGVGLSRRTETVRLGVSAARIGGNAVGSRTWMGSLAAEIRSGRMSASAELGGRPGRPPAWLVTARLDLSRWCRVESAYRVYPPVSDAMVFAPSGGLSTTAGTNPGLTSALRVTAGRWRIRLFSDQLAAASYTTIRRRPEVRTRWGVVVVRRFAGGEVSGFVSGDRRGYGATIEEGSTSTRGIVERSAFRSQLQLDFELRPSIQLILRLDHKRLSRGDESAPKMGTSLGHRLTWEANRRFRAEGGVTLFKADPSTPVYSVESEVRQQYSWLRLDGNGSRAYFRLVLQATRQLELQAKYAQTVYEASRSFGSGPEHVETDRLRTLSWSVQLVF